jgi:N-acetylglucosamine-6-phosphate deacetylase
MAPQSDVLLLLAMSASLHLRNCRLYDDPHGEPVIVHIVNGRIVAVGESLGETRKEDQFDAEGLILAPGLIDVHIHGAGGADALDGSAEVLSTMARALAAQGTTSFLATVFAPPSVEHAHLRSITHAESTPDGAHLLGLHVEGPFLNPKRKGGIPRETIYEGSPDGLAAILNACDGRLRMMTIAPEMAGNDAAIRTLAEHGVIAAMGHTDATYVETLGGFEAGVTHVTHLYNAMRPVHHREPGPIPAILETEGVTVQLIADGVHIGDDMLRWTVRQVGLPRCVLVSDGMAGTGLPEGTYLFNGREYESRNGTARYLDGTLIGTTLGLLGVARHFRSAMACSLADAIDAASLAPARVLGIDNRKGRIEPGYDADLVLLDDNMHVAATFVEGREVYSR